MNRALALILLACLPTTGRADGVVHEVDLRQIGLLDRNRPGLFGSLFNEDLDDDLLGLYAAYGLTLTPHRRLQVRTLLDTNVLRVIDGALFAGPRRIEDEIVETGLVREAWTSVNLPAGAEIGAGKRRVRLAEGLIFDEYALGADLTITAGPVQWLVGAWWPGRPFVPNAAPILGSQVDLRLDLSNTISLFVFGDAPDAQDGAPFVRELVSALLPELPTVGECATLRGNSLRYWMGGALNLLFEGQSIRAAGVWQLGHAAILPTALDAPRCIDIVRAIIEGLPRADAPITAFGLDAAWRARLHPNIYAGLFGTWLSGDAEPLAGNWTAFSPPAPLLPNTLLFFNGGATSTILDNTLTLSGVEGRGVRAAGITLLLVATERVEFDLLLAGLWPDAGEGTYGAEYDARVRARLGDRFDLRVEFGALHEGAVYDAPRIWWQLNAALGWRWTSD